MSADHQTEFSRQLLGHCLRWRARQDHGDSRARTHPLWDDWLDGLHPDWRAAGVQAVQGRSLHSHIRALNSSMAFAFNLFLPAVDQPGRLNGWASDAVGQAVVVDRVLLEWVPPGDLLGELAGPAPLRQEKCTAIDVVLWGHAGPDRVGLLLEVKLSEGGFTPCGGRSSRANRRPDLCASAASFLDDPDGCYLRRPVRAARDRRYWSIFRSAHGSVAGAHPGLARDGPCPFAADMQQPMRQHALALALEQAGRVDRAWVGLVHHDDNPDVTGPWDQYSGAVMRPERLFRRPASSVLACGDTAWAAWQRGRYRLPELT